MKIDIPHLEEQAPDINPEYLKELVVSNLYRLGTLSSSQSCEILNIRRRDFEETLTSFGISTMPGDKHSIDIELNQ